MSRVMGEETVAAAKKWCEIGARWIGNGAPRLGLNYIDRAIAVFAESVEVHWLTYARHQKLDGLKQTGWSEEAEALFEETMRGYTAMDNAYGKALLLSHLAECQMEQERPEEALTQLNLAAAIAEAEGLKSLLAHVLAQQARICLERQNLIAVVRLFRRAQHLLEAEGLDAEAMQLRFSAAEAMVRLGERADAIAFLEDLQSRLMRGLHFREALQPLNLLGRLYEESGSWDEKNRISQLVHLCGQHMIRGDGQPQNVLAAPPPIKPVEAPPRQTSTSARGGAPAKDEDSAQAPAPPPKDAVETFGDVPESADPAAAGGARAAIAPVAERARAAVAARRGGRLEPPKEL